MNDSQTSLVLLISHEEWASRSFESILKPHGYVVLKAYTGHQALELAAKIRPDVVMIEHRLPDMSGGEVCERLLALPTVRPSTPIVIFTSGTLSRRDRLEQVRLGAWDVLSPPFDPDEVLARLERYVAAKRDTDAALDDSHVDPLTGFYNRQGLVRRVRELTADASRSGRGLGCVVVGPIRRPTPDSNSNPVFVGVLDPTTGGDSVGRQEHARQLAHVMTRTVRISDSIGRVGEDEFVIVSPGIDQKGARRLADRLLAAVGERGGTSPENGAFDLRAEIFTGGDPVENMSPDEFVSHATSFLRNSGEEIAGSTTPDQGTEESAST